MAIDSAVFVTWNCHKNQKFHCIMSLYFGCLGFDKIVCFLLNFQRFRSVGPKTRKGQVWVICEKRMQTNEVNGKAVQIVQTKVLIYISINDRNNNCISGSNKAIVPKQIADTIIWLDERMTYIMRPVDGLIWDSRNIIT